MNCPECGAQPRIVIVIPSRDELQWGFQCKHNWIIDHARIVITAE